MGMRFAVLVAALLTAHTAAAASFDCKGAANATERTICADAKLSALDERTFKAYTDAVATLGIGDAPDFRNPVADLLLRGHEQWSGARDRCGSDANCLLTQYLRRIAVLTYHPDPQAPGPADAFIGRYAISVEPARELVVMSAPGGVVLMHVSVRSLDWTCDFGGVGRLDGAGRLRVTRPDFDGTMQGAHTVVLTPTRLGLALGNADKADDVSAKFCGDGGSLDQPYPRSDLVQ
jgi:uncharacterized protein YecT (DUF1311 family)